MLTKEEARAVALTSIAPVAERGGTDLVIIEKSILERDFAWVFPFNTREYVETGNIRKMALGLGPVVVNRATGAATLAPPMPIERFLEQYEKEL